MVVSVSATKARTVTRNGIDGFDTAVRVRRVWLRGDVSVPFGAVWGFLTIVLGAVHQPDTPASSMVRPMSAPVAF